MRFNPTRGQLADLVSVSGVEFIRPEPNSAQSALVTFARCKSFTVRQLAEGIHWADQSARISGTLALALRKASGLQIARLIDQMLRDGLSTMSEVPRWLNSHAEEVVA